MTNRQSRKKKQNNNDTGNKKIIITNYAKQAELERRRRIKIIMIELKLTSNYGEDEGKEEEQQ